MSNIHEGIHLDLSSIPKRQKKAIVKFMARIMEDSYRRGWEHGLNEDIGEVEHPFKLRFFRSLDKCPNPKTAKQKDSMIPITIDRLYAEYQKSLQEIGL